MGTWEKRTEQGLKFDLEQAGIDELAYRRRDPNAIGTAESTSKHPKTNQELADKASDTADRKRIELQELALRELELNDKESAEMMQ